VGRGLLGLGVVLSPAAAKLGTKFLLGLWGGIKDLGFEVEAGRRPNAILPANEGLTCLSATEVG